MSNDKIAVLRHPLAAMAKTWQPDGSVSGYGDAKYFRLLEREVGSLAELSALLLGLESQTTAVVIRGRYVGDKLARDRDGLEFQSGKVRRALDYFDDQALHTLLIDVDKWQGVAWDAVASPQQAIDEYLQTMLPDCFSGCGYHWQLSNSHGHPSKAGTLNAHIWMWSETAFTSAQLRRHFEIVAAEGGVVVDLTLYNPVQAHYTALPQFNDCEDPLAAAGVARSGYVPGLLGDSLALTLHPQAMAAVSGVGGRSARLRELAESDPIARALTDKGMVKGYARDGSMNITCPFNDEHTGESGETATQYFLPNTGGHALGQFKCLHSHCSERRRGEFVARLGVNEVAGAGFEDLDAEGGGSDGASGPVDGSVLGSGVGGDTVGGKPKKIKRGDVPEAQHLCTDLANANRIARHFKNKMMVVSDSWYTWNGKVWSKEESEVYRDSCLLSRLINAEINDWRARPVADDAERVRNAAIVKALEAWSKKSEGKGVIESSVGLLKKMLTVDSELIDRHPGLLNVRNGTIELKSSTLLPHDPRHLITRMIDIEYDASVKSDFWEVVLSQVTMETHLTTRPQVKFHKRWYGYCATGETREHKFLVHYGQGSNGKSTILDTVAAVLGEYAVTAPPGLLMASKSDKHPTEIASLFAKRMVTAHESGDGGVLKEDFIKQATGGDVLSARYMRGDFFEFHPTHKLQLVTNYKPIIHGQDNGIWRRILLVSYPARFGTQAEVNSSRAHYVKDTEVAAKLQREHQGVLTWIVEGAKEWYAEGLNEPDAVLAASKDYQSAQDRVTQFVEEMCECDREYSDIMVGQMSVYMHYQMWCKESGFNALSNQKFKTDLERIVPGFRVEFKVARLDGKTQRRVQTCYGLRIIGEYHSCV